MDMSLNEHALKKHVIRKGAEKLNEGTRINTPTEESVFKILNLNYRPPEERDFLIVLIFLNYFFIKKLDKFLIQ